LKTQGENTVFDKVIIGAGLYGLYAALFCGRRGERVLVLECDSAPFERASYVNQTRVHMGYHYPRSTSTALKTREHFDRFIEDYGFCINSSFDKIYATSSSLSRTNSGQFKKFCLDMNIPCNEVSAEAYFKENMCDGAFVTTEYTYDALMLKEWFVCELQKHKNVEVLYDVRIRSISNEKNFYRILAGDREFDSGFIVNTTYAGVNQIHALLGFEPIQIKYELCEVILCKPGGRLVNVGITVMDGAFFSIIPFGKTGLHSLTSVAFTPHMVCFDCLPTFPCQAKSDGYCTPQNLGNCNICPAKPETAWRYMSNLARKYLRDDFDFEYVESLFSMKPILKASEADDSRPTVIREYSDKPRFVSVLSGKINTLYELDDALV
jgi:hypothetical protein